MTARRAAALAVRFGAVKPNPSLRQIREIFRWERIRNYDRFGSEIGKAIF